MKFLTKEKREPVSLIRRLYMAKLLARTLIFVFCIFIYVKAPDQFEVLEGMNFFRKFSVLHILWAVWMIDMFFQLIPVKSRIPLGSQKLFRLRFSPIREKINYQNLKLYIVSTTKSAYRVLLLWTVLTAVLGVLYYENLIDKNFLLMTSVFFYVCDLICVLIWCPFRLLMGNRCCTTCRIFNWDHLMMFCPVLFAGGFFAESLVVVSVLVWLLWEFCVFLYPERFWEYTNAALKCANCTDKLCTQYCKKLRKFTQDV